MEARLSSLKRTAPDTDPASPAPPALFGVSPREWFVLFGVLVVMVFAYEPAWWGTPLWDDDHHLTAPALRSVEGLGRIWTDVGTTTQYYPVLHSTFWLLYAVWGDAVLGYHLLTIALHAVCAALVLITLRRLSVPSALLAAAIFALHPIQVESVAWMTELKNTLSTCFYFLAALAYLKFDDTRRPGPYAASIGIFIIALLIKSVTGMLPFALAVVFWWQRGVLNPRRDLLPLVPLVVLGVSMGLVTAWWEVEFNSTGSTDFAMTWIERGLLGGRAALFQLGNLAWPSELLFSYPRWTISAGEWRQHLYPMAVAVALAAAWLARRRTRAPLAAGLFYLLTLGPTLGAFNLYTFRYSFVADHYQYIACVGIFALAAAGVWPWLTGPHARVRLVARTCVISALIACTMLTWQQSHHYASAQASYTAILRGHPDSWLAHANLGALLLESEPRTAVTHLQEAIRLKPDLAQAHGNLGIALLEEGRVREAVTACVRALELNPALSGANHTLADAYVQLGRPDMALEHYRRAVQANPMDANLHASLGQVLTALGRAEEGLGSLRTAIELQPRSAQIRNSLGFGLAQAGQFEAAGDEHRRALELDPRSAAAHYGLGNLELAHDCFTEAAAEYRTALTLDPEGYDSHNNLGVALDRLHRPDEAEREFQASLALRPGFVDAAFNLAGLLERRHRLPEAAALYADLLSRDHDDLIVRLRLASVLVRLGKRDDAAGHVREVLRRQPGFTITEPLLSALVR